MTNGVFSVNIGDTDNGYPTALDYNFFDNKDVYLQIEVSSDNSSFETFGVRPRVTSSGFAINSKTVGGFTPSQTPTGSQIPVLTNNSLWLTGNNPQINATSTNALTLQGGASGDVMFYSSTTKITSAGSLSLAGTLSVASTSASSFLGSVAVGSTTAATLFSVATTTNIFNVTSAGLVGVGNSAPTGKFEVAAGGVSPALFVSNTNGNVGIGTTAPSSTLHVVGDIQGTSNLILPVSTATTGAIKLGTTRFIDAIGTGNLMIGTSGAAAGNTTLTGTYNIGIGGDQTMDSITSGGANIAIGRLALQDITTGTNNIAIGYLAGQNMDAGSTYNVVIGNSAVGGNATLSGLTGVGYNALGSASGAENTGVGYNAGQAITSGGYNTALGSNAMGPGAPSVTGDSNTAIGRASMYSLTGAAAANTAVGGNSLLGLTSGSYNTALGQGAGATITTGSNNTFIGQGADASIATSVNATAIGYASVVSASNTLILGGTGANAVNVGIGTSTPASLFTVATSTNAFQVQSDGSVIVGSPTGGAKGYGTINAQAVYDDNVLLTDYVFDKYFDGKVKDEDLDLHASYQMLTLPEAISFVNTNRHLPTITGRDEYKAKGGISLGKLATELWESAETNFLYITELNSRLEALEGVIANNANGGGNNANGKQLQGNLNGGLQLSATTDIRLPATFNKDSAGQAKIKAGDMSVRVNFEKEYTTRPVVVVSTETGGDFRFFTPNVSTKGFNIDLDRSATGDTVFNWIAVASADDALIYVSDGTTQLVNVTVVTAPPAPAIQVPPPAQGGQAGAPAAADPAADIGLIGPISPIGLIDDATASSTPTLQSGQAVDATASSTTPEVAGVTDPTDQSNQTDQTAATPQNDTAVPEATPAPEPAVDPAPVATGN